MELPKGIAEACAPLFTAVPLDHSMCRLTGGDPAHTAMVQAILEHPSLSGRSDLAAGLWLYVDDLERSHSVSQSISDSAGSFWHGIMHRREGDFSNSHYWIRRAAEHPLIGADASLDPHALIEAVSKASGDDAALVARQRQEWAALFAWCANRR